MTSIEGTVSFENKDIYKMKLGPTSHQLSDFFGLGHRFIRRTSSSLKNHTFSTSATKPPSFKKWQVGRVSRKQYEIINMLWRKTGQHRNVDISTSHFYPSESLFRKPTRLKSSPSTSSFIEFYYLDEDVNQKNPLYKDDKPQSFEKVDQFKRATAKNYPKFSFRINGPNLLNKKSVSDILKIQTPSSLIQGLPNYVILQIPSYEIPYTTTFGSKRKNKVITYETCPATETLEPFDQEHRNKDSRTMMPRLTSVSLEPTTVYDRIKFFEIYDKGTPSPPHNGAEKLTDLNDVERSIHGNTLRKDLRIILETVSQNQTNNNIYKTKHAKKHIIESNKRNYLNLDDNINSITSFNLTTRNRKSPSRSVTETISALTKFVVNKISVVAKWSDYSFMAAYIYEPSQVSYLMFFC